MLSLKLGKEILILGHQDPLPVVIEVWDITSEAGEIGHEFFPNF